MKEQILEKLFESPAKTRLLKLFLRNSKDAFSVAEIRRRTKLDSGSVKRQLRILHEINLVKANRRKKEQVFSVNPAFAFHTELSNLVLKSSPASKEKILKKIKGLGKIKLAILSGIFIEPEPSHRRVDILLVGDAVSERKLNTFIQALEAESGSEIKYSLLGTEEFEYRYRMFDKFVHDVLEKSHEKIINKLVAAE